MAIRARWRRSAELDRCWELLERFAAARVLDVGDESRAIPAREYASDLRVTEARLIFEDPKAVARQRKQTGDGGRP